MRAVSTSPDVPSARSAPLGAAPIGVANAVDVPREGRPSRAYRFSQITLIVTIGVILWGAYVRVSGSGAGCGSHWPTCHGEVVPRAPSIATLIELTHRLTSGIAFLMVLAQAVAQLRRAGLARRGALASLFFMITEALIGAGLVLFEKVAHDKSIARGYWMSAHLINTFLLLAAMTVTTWALYPASREVERTRHVSRWMLVAAFAATMLVGVSGAIAALGDTLFPASSLAEGIRSDVAAEAHTFVRLRVLHPFVAIASALGLLLLTARCTKADGRLLRSGQILGSLVILQVFCGVVNLLLLAPAFMQLVHLLMADALWIALVVVALESSAFSAPPSTTR
jgi:heme a synthase